MAWSAHSDNIAGLTFCQRKEGVVSYCINYVPFRRLGKFLPPHFPSLLLKICTNSKKIKSMSSSKLKGPRPAPLMVSNDSHKVNKPAKKPTIIYMVAPEIIHVEADEFMPLVQRLTGRDSPSPGELGNSSEGMDQSNDKEKHQLPVKVKACAINRDAGSAKHSSESITSPPLFFHDLSPLSRGGGALKEAAAASQGWLHHHTDFLGQAYRLPSSVGLGSPTFLDIFGSLSPPQPQP